MKIGQLDKDVAVGQLFREKSTENSCGEESLERICDERTVWGWNNHPNSMLLPYSEYTISAWESPKGVCNKNILTFSRLLYEQIHDKCKLGIFITVCRIYL